MIILFLVNRIDCSSSINISHFDTVNSSHFDTVNSSHIATVFTNTDNDVDVIISQSGFASGDVISNRSTNNNSAIINSTNSCVCSTFRDNSTFIAANFQVKQIISNANYTLFKNSSTAQGVFIDTVSSVLLLQRDQQGDDDDMYGLQYAVVSINSIQCSEDSVEGDISGYSGSSLNLRRSLERNLLSSCTDVSVAYSVFFKNILYYNITSVDLAYSALRAALEESVSSGLFESNMRLFVESKGLCAYLVIITSISRYHHNYIS